MNVQLISKTQSLIENVSTEELVAYVARIGKVKDNPARLLKYLIKNKHWSPFMHVYFGFKIETSRAIGRQMLRHSSLSMQEWSQRYEEEIMGFEPIELRKKAEKNRQSSEEPFDPDLVYYDTYPYQEGEAKVEIFRQKASKEIEDYLNYSKELYNRLVKEGVASECARMILPECTKTTLIFTGNIRSWLHFLDLRLDSHSQKEVRLIAEDIQAILMKEIPSIFETKE